MNELDSFFARKANKAKKKGVIRLQEVAEQLERRARIQVFFLLNFRLIFFLFLRMNWMKMRQKM